MKYDEEEEMGEDGEGENTFGGDDDPETKREVANLEGDGDDDEEEDYQIGKKRTLEKKNKIARRKRLIEVKREKESRYYAGTSYSRPSSTFAYALAKNLNRDSAQLLWFWILGVTEMYTSKKHTIKQYKREIRECEGEVKRVCPESKTVRKESKSKF